MRGCLWITAETINLIHKIMLPFCAYMYVRDTREELKVHVVEKVCFSEDLLPGVLLAICISMWESPWSTRSKLSILHTMDMYRYMCNLLSSTGCDFDKKRIMARTTWRWNRAIPCPDKSCFVIGRGPFERKFIQWMDWGMNFIVYLCWYLIGFFPICLRLCNGIQKNPFPSLVSDNSMHV